MGDTIYIDSQSVEHGIYNGLVTAMPDIGPLVRAAYVFELQEVEKRLDALGKLDAIRSPGEESKASKSAMEALWRRRGELLGLLWPAMDVEDSSPEETAITPDEARNLANTFMGGPVDGDLLSSVTPKLEAIIGEPLG